MPYLNLELNYFDHIKTLRLEGILGRGAAELPIRLWSYCGKHRAKDGNLAGYSAGEIEALIRWQGNAGECVAALIKVGFLERTPEGYQVHDWQGHEGHLISFHIRAKAAAAVRWCKPGASEDDAPSNATSIAPSNAPSVPTKPYQPNQPTKPRDSKPTPPNGGSAHPKIIPDHVRGLSLYEADDKLCWRLPEVFGSWESAYPGVNIANEIAKAHAWEMANPQKRKRDRIKFLTNWLNRAQDRGGSYGRGNVGAGGSGYSGRGQDPIAGLASPSVGKYADSAIRDKKDS